RRRRQRPQCHPAPPTQPGPEPSLYPLPRRGRALENAPTVSRKLDAALPGVAALHASNPFGPLQRSERTAERRSVERQEVAKRALGNCCLLDAVVSNGNHLYIHQYGYRMDRRRGSVDRPAARLLPRRVAPTCARRARAAVVGAGDPDSLRHGRRHAPALHHGGAGTGTRAVAYAPYPARHVSTGRTGPREAVSRVRARLSWPRLFGHP